MTKLILTFSLLSISFLSFSQSLIVGIPSADVAPEGEFEVTHESQFYTAGNPRKWNSFNILCFGLDKNTELTATLNNLNNLDNSRLALGLGLKKIIPLHQPNKHDFKWTTGGNMLFSLRKNDVGGWIYSHLSARIPVLNTRITAGISYGSHHNFGYRIIPSEAGVPSTKENLTPFCFIGGIKQPVYKNWSIIADWYSGTHNLADFIPAIQYRYNHQVFIAGYKFPNPGSGGKEAFIFEMMLSLPGWNKKSESNSENRH